MEFDTSGEPRKELRSDGWYVLGGGMLIPVRDEEEAEKVLKKMHSSSQGSKDS